MPIQYPYDVSMLLHDGAAALTATGNGQVGGSARVFDTESTTSPVGRFPLAVVINANTIDLTSANETYDAIIQGSNAADFSSGVQELGSIAIPAAGRYTLIVDNEQGSTVYRYIRFRAALGGTTPSFTGIVYAAPAVVV
ncbi:MAG: hypothetical protein IOB84_13660 [Brevundimonas sp.]|nr:hypothetical protein [Brevundimonas sp.]